MKIRTAIARFALGVGAIVALALLGLIGLSYHDVRTSVGPTSIRFVSVLPSRTHLLEVRWRMGEFDPDHDMPGQYVYWTLKPKQVWFVK